MPDFRRFRALAPGERRVLVQSIGLLPLVAASLRIAGVRRTQAWLDGMLPVTPRGDGLEASRVARMVMVAARRGLVRPRCLCIALALRALLRRQGRDAVVRVGVRKQHGRLEAHAWVEQEGRALPERGTEHNGFAAFEAALPGR